MECAEGGKCGKLKVNVLGLAITVQSVCERRREREKRGTVKLRLTAGL